MADRSTQDAAGRHRAHLDGPVVPASEKLGFALVGVVLVAGAVAMVLDGEWATVLCYAAILAAAMAVAGVCAWLEHRDAPRHGPEQTMLPAVPAPARSDPDATLPVAMRSDWTLPTSVQLLPRAVDATADVRWDRRFATARALVLLAFFAGAGAFLFVALSGPSMGCADCDTVGAHRTAWATLAVCSVSALVFPALALRRRPD